MYTSCQNKTGAIYVGTDDLERRVFEHKAGLFKGFTKKYSVDLLVYFEEFQYIEDAIAREKQIKGVETRKEESISGKRRIPNGLTLAKIGPLTNSRIRAEGLDD